MKNNYRKKCKYTIVLWLEAVMKQDADSWSSMKFSVAKIGEQNFMDKNVPLFLICILLWFAYWGM